MATIISLEELLRQTRSEVLAKSHIIFGGTFDPIHIGHVSVIRRLLTHFKCVLLAPTGQNPWKEKPATSLDCRKEMIELVLEAEKIPICRGVDEQGVFVLDIPYTYTEELLEKLKKKMGNEPAAKDMQSNSLFWAVGEDYTSSVKEWRNFKNLPLTVVMLPVTIPIHSTDIRASKRDLHPAILGYVQKKSLYSHGK